MEGKHVSEAGGRKPGRPAASDTHTHTHTHTHARTHTHTDVHAFMECVLERSVYYKWPCVAEGVINKKQ